MFEVKTDFGTYSDLFLMTSHYCADNSLAVYLVSESEGPFATLTVCLDDKNLEDLTNYIDTNNCPWAMDFIEKNGLGKRTGKEKVSGYCIYPQVKFSYDALKKAVEE